jgi:hypothetical protein
MEKIETMEQLVYEAINEDFDNYICCMYREIFIFYINKYSYSDDYAEKLSCSFYITFFNVLEKGHLLVEEILKNKEIFVINNLELFNICVAKGIINKEDAKDLEIFLTF